MSKTAVLCVLLSIMLLGTLVLYANVLTVKSANFVGSTIYLRADGSIDPADAPIDVHGTTYTLTGDIECPRFGPCIYIERSGILLDGYGYTIEGWDLQDESSVSSNAIYAGEVSNISIRNINIKGCFSGINVQRVQKASIFNTTIDGLLESENGEESTAISLSDCDDVNVEHNQLVHNYMGILIQYSNCTVANNRIMDNTGAGIYLLASGISVTSNIIARNDLGIEILGSDNLIEANDILSNKRIGVYLSDSPNNIFVENNIAGQNGANAYGVQMSPYGSGATFYHNDFANNYVHIDGGDLAIFANIWDNGYPSGGNYWDTYHGFDDYSGPHQNETGSDGIGDTPYQITQANIDRYPLMTLFRPIPEIGEEPTPTTSDYTLLIIIAVIIAGVVLASGFAFYRRRKKEQPAQDNLPRPPERFLVGRIMPIFLTLSLMIIFNFTFISMGIYGLGALGVFGGALYFDEVLLGFLSSIAGIFVTWRIIIRQKYLIRRREEMLLAVVASFLFTLYLLAYSAYHSFELFGFLQVLQPALVVFWTFATSLVGCCVGFLLGGVGLRRTQLSANLGSQPEGRQKLAAFRVGAAMAILFAGLISGYAAGYVSWAVFGQIEVGLGMSFPYVAEFPPSLTYLIGWAVVGAFGFSLGALLKRARFH
jgi:parallel beta-helix repeat protein